MNVQTHLAIDHALCGYPIALREGEAVVQLEMRPQFAVDAHGLVHGGFVFGAVDHAAMLAVNLPNVVLGEVGIRFVAPVRVGDTVLCEARVTLRSGKRHVISVRAIVGETEVLTGTLTAFVLANHVLDGVARA